MQLFVIFEKILFWQASREGPGIPLNSNLLDNDNFQNYYRHQLGIQLFYSGSVKHCL